MWGSRKWIIFVLSSMLIAPCILISFIFTYFDWYFRDFVNIDDLDMYTALSMFNQNWRTENKTTALRSRNSLSKPSIALSRASNELSRNEELKQLFKNEIPLTREIYKVLRKHRWEMEQINRTVEMSVWVKVPAWGAPERLIEIECPRRGTLFKMKISKTRRHLGKNVDAIVHHVRSAPRKTMLDLTCRKARRKLSGPACVMWTGEPPTWDCCRRNRGSEPSDEKWYTDNFDFGLTYKIDHQHIFTPYDGFFTWDKIFKPLPANFMENKQELIGFLQGNCGGAGNGGRQFLVRGIMDALAPDNGVVSFGGCLRNTEEKISREDPEESERISRFKFWIALENSVCDSYITEKFTRPLKAGSIPIVFETSGLPGYGAIWPEHSYINAGDYPDVHTLAKDIIAIANDDERYLSYFKWRKNASAAYASKVKFVDNLLSAGFDIGTEEGCKHHNGNPQDKIEARWGTKTGIQFYGSWCSLAAKIDKAREAHAGPYFTPLAPMSSCIGKAMANLVDVPRICALEEKGHKFKIENFC